MLNTQQKHILLQNSEKKDEKDPGLTLCHSVEGRESILQGIIINSGW